ncbi:class I SAM-dependent methyltransferase [Paenibacillus anaericanus]|uniref:Class I SAM-dependent methyltransferase n=1 Tax=Paenibacillus anaericanus TaxID=170367 RepID=A0A433Y678_9BACL|nr:class I SAM-dependent methyltransferase [Paenibacillus anaericanus]RUT44416.1 class I SAM-dependent methyltransferase [Paenibacillus anaericanus]
MPNELIRNTDDILNMLDALMREPVLFWDKFYSDRSKKVPFFINHPDENLVSYLDSGHVQVGKVLEVGCGPGRNAIYLAQKGFTVDAVDISEEAIRWAQDRVNEHNVDVNFQCISLFELQAVEEYDFVYDSGCLHHIWPHRRIEYIEMLNKALKPGGYFGLSCFAPGFAEIGGALDTTDWEVYRERNMKGGQAYSEEQLKILFQDYFDCVEYRVMTECSESEEKFGVPFLGTSLWRKK